MLDVYRYDSDTTPKPTNWAWTLGLTEYTWLKNTLENSTAKYKFVFAHHIRGEGRGGLTNATLYEWGGHDGPNGINYSFPSNRPGWAKPIHQLFIDNGVNIFFQGHDHLFAHEVLDSVTYQEVPMAADSTYQIGMLANANAYTSDTLAGTGHLRVTVNANCVTVDFVRAYLPADTVSGVHHNREIPFTYSLGNCTSGVEVVPEQEKVMIYPNPATDRILVRTPAMEAKPQLTLRSLLGQPIIIQNSNALDVSTLPNGVYLLNVHTNKIDINKKVLINR